MATQLTSSPDQQPMVYGGQGGFELIQLSVRAGEISSFVAGQKRAIEAELGHLGLKLRRATLDDMPTLFELQRHAFPNYRPEQLMNDQTLYRIVEFDRPVILSDAAGEALGYHLVMHLNDEDKTALSCGLVIHGRLKGLGLGTLIYRHTALRSMEAGAQVLRGIVKSTNFSSLAVLLNKMGGFCDRFHARLGASRDYRFRHGCELTPEGLGRRPIDLDQLVDFAQTTRRGRDYQIVAPDDFDAIERLYAETSHRVMGVVPAGLLAEQTMLFALPLGRLGAIRAELERETMS